ncbi:MAG: hypothetical protein P4L42_14070 [Desulfocapsaceae bacterium]|nr:hypothetical protein [Desulfocapsaceae bacterium]
MEKIPCLPTNPDSYDSPKLPKAAKTSQILPNVLLQSALFGMVQRGRRKYHERHKIASFNNVCIYFTGAELDQGDLDVFIHAVHLASRSTNPFGVEFTVRGFLRELGKKPGKSGQDWLFNSIRRLSACLVEIHCGNQHTVLSMMGGIYGGPLIFDFFHYPEKNKFFLRVNSNLGSMFDYGWAKISWQKRLQANTSLAKWLHGLYSSMIPYPLKIETIYQLSRSSCKDTYKFRFLLKNALNELVAIGVFKSWEIAEEGKVHVIPSPRNPPEP